MRDLPGCWDDRVRRQEGTGHTLRMCTPCCTYTSFQQEKDGLSIPGESKKMVKSLRMANGTCLSRVTLPHNVNNGRATSNTGFHTEDLPQGGLELAPASAPQESGGAQHPTATLPFPWLQAPFTSRDPTWVQGRRTWGKGRPCRKSSRPRLSQRPPGSGAPAFLTWCVGIGD